MMFRVDTPFWERNLYIFSDIGWGRVYVIHGLAGTGLIALVMTHVYFAVRPEKWWITRSMFKGWITRREFLEHHDPQRWTVGAAGPEAAPAPRAERELVSVGAASDSGREPSQVL
jgi:hypothetical protein